MRDQADVEANPIPQGDKPKLEIDRTNQIDEALAAVAQYIEVSLP